MAKPNEGLGFGQGPDFLRFPTTPRAPNPTGEPRIGPPTRKEVLHDDMESMQGVLGGGMAGILEGEGVQGAPVLRSIGKRIDELLDTIFTTPARSGLPRRLRFTNWDARTGEMQLHAERGTYPTDSPAGYRITPKEMDQLIESGKMDLAQPPAADVTRVQKKLNTALGPVQK